MSRTYKFVGGPLHGERRALPSPTYRVPVDTIEQRCQRHRNYQCRECSTAAPRITTVEYEERSVDLGGHVRLRVMAVATLTDQEFFRRIADLIEA